jgi:hypothetical protein
LKKIVVNSDDDLSLKDRKAKLLSCEEVLSVERIRQDGLNVLAEVSMDVHVGMPTEGRKRGPPPEASLNSRKVFHPLTYFADSKYSVDSHTPPFPKYSVDIFVPSDLDRSNLFTPAHWLLSHPTL